MDECLSIKKAEWKGVAQGALLAILCGIVGGNRRRGGILAGSGRCGRCRLVVLLSTRGGWAKENPSWDYPPRR